MEARYEARRELAWAVIVAVRDPCGPYNTDIYVMNADGSGQRRLTRNPVHDARLRWIA